MRVAPHLPPAAAITQILPVGVLIAEERSGFFNGCPVQLGATRCNYLLFIKFVCDGRVPDPTSHFPPDLILYVNLNAMGTT